MEATHKFDAEVDKILQLMIHSLYANKDIFLRELISNAADACDKLRFLSKTQENLIDGEALKISISADEKARTLTIQDNGIGMSMQELQQNLGTIARSGTQKFLEQLSKEDAKNTELIGQFGVGFYSCFMVADFVTVKSLKAGETEGFIWSSDGKGSFKILKSQEKLNRGTTIILSLKDGEEGYLDQFKIQHIVKTYSDHIAVPIEFVSNDSSKDNSPLNTSSALWKKNKSEVTEDEYKAFYKQIAFAGDVPYIILHNKNEGLLEYTNLLFIPEKRTFDLFHPDRKRQVKLYIKKVFINDDGVDIIPHHLRFMRGVIDAECLPLNISRETLQHNPILTKIKGSVTNRVLSELAKKLVADRSSYIEFWKNFGAVLKEGLCDSVYGTNELLNVCMFKSMKTGEFITLKEYVDNMVANQNEIFYISGNDEENLSRHPQLEGFRERNVDVLLFTDAVDDFWVNVLNTFADKQLKSVTRTDINLQDMGTNAETKSKDPVAEEGDGSKVLEFFKKILDKKVQDVKASRKLTSTAVCLTVSEGGMDINMEKYMLEQKQINSGRPKILEINLKHPVIKLISEKVQSDSVSTKEENLVNLLYAQACVIEGIKLEDSS